MRDYNDNPINYIHLSNFGSGLPRLRDIADFVSQMPLLHTYPSSFTQHLETFPLELDRWQCSAVSQVHELISSDFALTRLPISAAAEMGDRVRAKWPKSGGLLYPFP